jgi:hypothetical protein
MACERLAVVGWLRGEFEGGAGDFREVDLGVQNQWPGPVRGLS